MLKDVGMAVPKTREARVVYMPQDKDYDNNTMRNPDINQSYFTPHCYNVSLMTLY